MNRLPIHEILGDQLAAARAMFPLDYDRFERPMSPAVIRKPAYREPPPEHTSESYRQTALTAAGPNARDTRRVRPATSARVAQLRARKLLQAACKHRWSAYGKAKNGHPRRFCPKCKKSETL